MFNPFSFLKNKTRIVPDGSKRIRPMILLVLDGWGIAPDSPGNAIVKAKTPNFDRFISEYPHGELIASGESVGLPANEEGNSEVGHLTMGAGRVVLQSLQSINKSIEMGSFFENRAFLQAVAHVKEHNSALHLMGLVGSGEVHSSIKHLYALLEFCKRQKPTQVFLHLFTDGRDAPPKEAKDIIAQIEVRLSELAIGRIATISGRYYGLDRDRRWDRTQKVYDATVLGKGIQVSSAKEAIEKSYSQGKTDEFVEPSVVRTSDGMSVATVNDNDAVIFFNFRIDRPRQLTMAFTMANFESLHHFEFSDDPYRDKYEGKGGREIVSGPTFKREKKLTNVFFVTMTEYQKKLPVSSIAFPPEHVTDSLPQIFSENNIKQLRLAESEKERMVTFYFDGMMEKRFVQEDVVIIPSAKVATYDKKPQMSVGEIVSAFKKAISRGEYRFYLINFANCDMVAHSGNLAATIAAVEHVDRAFGEVVEATLSSGGTVVVSADHGNAEELLTYPTGGFFYTTKKGSMNTEHSNNPVPLLIVNSDFAGKPKVLPKGNLSDIAPTILGMMGLPVPSSMTGRNLLKQI